MDDRLIVNRWPQAIDDTVPPFIQMVIPDDANESRQMVGMAGLDCSKDGFIRLLVTSKGRLASVMMPGLQEDGVMSVEWHYIEERDSYGFEQHV